MPDSPSAASIAPAAIAAELSSPTPEANACSALMTALSRLASSNEFSTESKRLDTSRDRESRTSMSRS